MSGSVIWLQRCLGHRLPMYPLVVGELDPEGLAGDAHRAAGAARQLLLQDAEVLEDLDLSAGIVRENITVRGAAVNGMPPGTRLRIGEAVVEVTGECTPCSLMDEIRPGLEHELEGRRGTYARVVAPGPVTVGDAVFVIAEPEGAAP